MLLEVKNLHCHYGLFEAVCGVSFEVEAGSIVGILGNNGAGKSTTLRTISGLMKATEGDIWFDGQLLNNVRGDRRVAMGIAQVPEGKGLFPYLTVFENLRLGASARRDRDGVERDLEDVFNRYPILKQRRKQLASTLSGGEQTQLAIARGVMARPKLLMLDEPMQGLAPLIIGEVEQMILELRSSGMTIVMVEHNVNMACGMCDKLVVFELGQIIAEGKPDELSESECVKMIYLV
jgi:branched-chain amino acid transport system ATP-binding protein